jgi:hypothetical protein
MAGSLRVYSAAFYENAGNTYRMGSMDEPVKGEATATNGGHQTINQEFTIPPGECVLVWDGSDGRRYTFLSLRVADGEGYVEVYELVDTPKDADGDPTPSGDIPRWRECDLSCFGELMRDTDVRRTHATLGTEVGTDGDGLPSMATQAGSVEGRHYKTAVKNRSTTDSVKVRLSVIY